MPDIEEDELALIYEATRCTKGAGTGTRTGSNGGPRESTGGENPN